MEKGTKVTILGAYKTNLIEMSICVYSKGGNLYLDENCTKPIEIHYSTEDKRYNHCIEFPDDYVCKRFYTNLESPEIKLRKTT